MVETSAREVVVGVVVGVVATTEVVVSYQYLLDNIVCLYFSVC